MRLLINTDIPLIDPDLGSKPHWIDVNDRVVLAQKITLYTEENMVNTMQWLEENSKFDTRKLTVCIEDCVKFYWEQ